jgi:hypothetical protein
MMKRGLHAANVVLGVARRGRFADGRDGAEGRAIEASLARFRGGDEDRRLARRQTAHDKSKLAKIWRLAQWPPTA